MPLDGMRAPFFYLLAMEKKSRMRWLLFSDTRPLLHRWCHRSSPAYALTCEWEKKVDLANRDNTAAAHVVPPPPPPAEERDVLSVFAVDGFGV